MTFLNEYGALLLSRIAEHLIISMSALALGVLVALPIGIAISRNRNVSNLIIATTSLLQTIPSLALLAMMVPLVGVGRFPAILALFIYSLLPILRNVVLGMNAVDTNVLDAAKGMGLNVYQRILKVQLPLATPIIMAGIRLSCVYVIAWATLASYIGAGGLGDFIFTGLNTFDFEMILAGTLPVTLLALSADAILGALESLISPKLTRKEDNI